MYTSKDFPSKKALKEAVAAGEKITVFQPNNIFNVVPKANGQECVKGPQYPKAHKWYAEVTLTNGFISKVK